MIADCFNKRRDSCSDESEVGYTTRDSVSDTESDVRQNENKNQFVQLVACCIAKLELEQC
jgi:hypothetical protein